MQNLPLDEVLIPVGALALIQDAIDFHKVWVDHVFLERWTAFVVHVVELLHSSLVVVEERGG